MESKSLRWKISINNLALKDKILLGFVISSILPILILIYMFLNFITPETYQIVKGSEFINIDLLVPLVVLLSLLGVFITLDIAKNVRRLVKRTEDVYPHLEFEQDRGIDEIDQLSRNFSVVVEKMEEQRKLLSDFEKDLQNTRKQLKISQAQLKEMASRDELTGLFNRRFLKSKLEDELSRAKRYNHPLCVIFLDIDEFKDVNDKYGHPVGDIVLREFADLLQDSFREVDIVARYGGEEFCIILPETRNQEAKKAAMRARRKIEKHGFLRNTDHPQLRITASMGVFLCDPENDSPEDILQKADQALYKAKGEGRNRVVEY